MIQRNGTEAGLQFSEELQLPTIVERVVWLQNIFIFTKEHYERSIGPIAYRTIMASYLAYLVW